MNLTIEGDARKRIGIQTADAVTHASLPWAARLPQGGLSGLGGGEMSILHAVEQVPLPTGGLVDITSRGPEQTTGNIVNTPC